ncbi:MAG: DUF1707 domain-containing protein, partial [Haloechinothrix sp.]
TQVIKPVSPPHGVRQPLGQAPDAERTQAVQYGQPQQYGPASPAGGFPQPQEQPWNAAHDDASPPWGGSEFPPVAPSTDADWVKQGPESFNDSPSHRGRTIGIVLAAVLILGLGVAVVFFFTSGDNKSDPVASPPSTIAQPTTEPLPEPPPAKAAPEDNADALIKPPGKTRGGGGDFDLATLEDTGLLPVPIVEALKQADMKEGLLRTTSEGGSTIGLYALEVAGEDQAASVAGTYANVQQSGGLPANESLSLQGVPVFSTPNNAQDAVYRSVYVVHNHVVIVETFGSDRETVQALFTKLLANQVEHAPPTVRSA